MFAKLLIVLAILGTALPVLAQGTKDPSNFGTTISKPSTSTGASRPTATPNTPTDQLPTGVAVQRTYRDGKLVPYVR